ncbi:bifunctional serine/threonine-protein kinase/ABC transporter substrate-binding protein [Streptomyces sp. NPDC003035]|uniref:bifunctional serine/threonine-protein kinase/ABC transporter substrate-binding protein n=1 Tax=Streptomyces sp. NPDC003035 TaxID=3364676 RepID=UPI00369B0F6A
MSPAVPPASASSREPAVLQPLLPSDPSAIAGYRLLGRLGAGGMGVVYLGRTDSGELAAVKVTHADHADQPDFRARFRREVEAARRVSSPWAVPVTGADPDAPEPWMATAFVPGPSLGEAVTAHGPLPERSVRILGGALARALAAVHAAGLVHRDVKPGNVLLAVDGPRLIDFGIARTTGETALTSTDMVVGTPGFLAPEQAEARAAEIGPPSDVFALGCLLAHAATGRPPFGTGAVDALLYRTVHDEPDLDGVPEALLPLVTACLAKDPAERPTAAEIAARLTEDTPGGAADWLPAPVVRTIAERSAAMLALPEIDATRPGASAPDGRPAPSRRKFLLASGGAVLAVGGGIGAWATLRDDGTGRKATPPPKKRRWVIGVHADLTGPAKDIGRAQERGARLAVEQFNAREDKPFTLELKVSDDGGDKNKALAAARVLTGDPDVLGVLGPTSDYTGLAALPAYDEALVPLITVSAGLNLLSNAPGGQGLSVLQACPQHAIAGTYLAYYVLTKSRSVRPGILQERTDDTYAWQYTGGANFGFRQGKVTPLPRVVPGATTDYKRVLGAMMADGMDAYVHCGLTPSAVLAARALDELGFTGLKVTGQHVFEPRFPAEAGDAAEGWVLGAPVVDATTVKAASPFVAAYRKRYGTAPAFYTGESFDLVNLLAQELARAAKAGKRPDRRTLAPLLRKAGYQGIMGGYVFDPETGQLRTGVVGTFMYVVENGRYKALEFAPAGPPKNRRT